MLLRVRSILRAPHGHIVECWHSGYAPLFPPAIVLVVPGIDFDATIPDLEHSRSQLVDEVAIMRNQHDGSGIRSKRLEQNVFGPHIEMVRRLVEQKKICWMHEQSKKSIAPALTAREHADALEDVIGLKQEAAQQAAQFGLRRTRRNLLEVVKNARVGIEFFVLILREIVGLDVVSQFVFARAQRFRSRKQLDES